MATVHRKAYTMPLPKRAQIIERDGVRIARWRLRNGKLRTAEVVDGQDGTIRVRGRSAFYTAKYRDGSGETIELSTGCRDETAARAILAQLERRAELVKAGVLTLAESDSASHGKVALKRHLDAYQKHLDVKGCAPRIGWSTLTGWR